MYGTLPPESGTELTLALSAFELSPLERTDRRSVRPIIGTGLVLAALAVFAVRDLARHGIARSDDRPILIACWLGVAVLIVWTAAFLNHTAVHPYFMARLLVIPVIGAAILLAARWPALSAPATRV